MSDIMLDIVYYVVAGGGEMSWQRAASTVSEDEAGLSARQSGEPLIPILRIDVDYQHINADIAAVNTRAELGFGPIGIELRETNYKQTDPADRMAIQQWHLLYRMSFGDHVGVDLGIGNLRLDGNALNEGESFTLPIHIHPTDHIGVDWRQTWSSMHGSEMKENDLGISLHRPFTSLRLGYRWLKAKHAELNGPYLGMALHF